jgi:predicted Zn-dependent protease with MMP-like domain
MPDLFDVLDELWLEGDLHAVERAALEGLDGLQDEDDRAVVWSYVASARFEQGLYRQAVEASKLAGDALYEAMACFHLWQFDQAARALERFEGGGEDLADAEWYRGLLKEFAGDDPSEHYRRAVLLAPRLYRKPERLADRAIDTVVNDALQALPPKVQKAVENAVVEVVDLPAPHPDVDPLTLGLYHGLDMLQRGSEDTALWPSRITVFRRNVERIPDPVEELRITLLHEIGHHLGMDEDRLEDAGYG